MSERPTCNWPKCRSPQSRCHSWEPEKRMTVDWAEWREQIGVRVMHAMKCTHQGEDFGNGAVCVTCFDNTQRIGALVERIAAAQREAGAAEVAERVDEVLTANGMHRSRFSTIRTLDQQLRAACAPTDSPLAVAAPPPHPREE